MTTESEAPDGEPFDVVAIQQANNARRLYLAQHGAPVNKDAQYTVSLLEFMIVGTGGEELLNQARIFHEVRVAPILDAQVARLTEVEEERRTAAATAALTRGVPGVPPRA